LDNRHRVDVNHSSQAFSSSIPFAGYHIVHQLTSLPRMSFSSRSDPYEQYKIACDAYDLAKSTRSVTPVYKSRYEHALMECRQVEVHKIQPCDRARMYSMMGESIVRQLDLHLWAYVFIDLTPHCLYYS
jgi:hypothetical protein